MALTFSTGMTVDDTAQAITNFGGFALTGAIDRAPSVITSHGAMGANCIGLASDWILTSSVVIMYDYFTSHASTALNLSTVGNEVIAIWFHVADPGLCDTLVNGGVYIIASSSTDTGATVPTAYRRWYVSGKDVFRATAKAQWYLAMIDTRKAASVADVGAFSLTTVHRFGIGQKNAITESVGGPPPENLFVGGVQHGRPIYQVIGDGAITATWNDILTHSLTTQQNGLIENHGGAYKLSCGIRFGSATQAATTTFSDATNPVFVFKRSTYYLAGEVDALNYSDYYLVDAQGAASFKTSVTLGSVVGTADARQGVKGSTFLTSDLTNVPFNADFTSANLTAANLYGTRWFGATRGIKFDSNLIGLVISDTFQNCGEVDCGTVGSGATLLNCTLIDPQGGTAQNNGLKLPSLHNIKNVSFITSGTPTTQHMLDLSTSGAYSVTMDNLQFFGTYSGTVLHGDLSSATLSTVTGNATNGANPNATLFSKTGNASSTIIINNTKTLKVTVKNSSGTVLQDAQVYMQKLPTDTDVGHPGNRFTAGAGNTRGNGTFVVTQAVPSDIPSTGMISVQNVALGQEQPYRYTSKSGSTFTFNAALTGTDSGTGNATTLNETNIGTKNIVEGDTIQNTTDNQWAIVLSVATNSLTTTPLSNGATWAAKAYSVHTLAFTYTSAVDTAYVPLLYGDTNASGILTGNYNYSVDKNVLVKVRKMSGGTNYLPYSSSQTITTNGLDLSVTLTTDTINAT